MNEQLASFFGGQGLLIFSLAWLCLMFGAIWLDTKKLWPKILLTIGIILALGAFALWSLAIFHNTIA